MTSDSQRTTCCIAGGGPAGMMLGYLLARAGIRVTVLEKHNDLFRDFRGDTVHPSTLQLMDELGLLDELLQIAHRKITTVSATFGGVPLEMADLGSLRGVRCPYVALMPQWDFLNFLSRKAAAFPGFELRMGHEVKNLVVRNGRIGGVEVNTADGVRQMEAELVVACDGRRSILRQAAGLPLRELGVPIDVLWFRISRNPSDPEPHHVVGNINYGKILILIDRGDYFQAGMIIRKGSFPHMQREGLDAFRSTIARIAPNLTDRVGELEKWEQVKLLCVQINRLRKWHRPGLLCIGDAAHAMSPAFGVGINLAIQDAVATARILTDALQRQPFDDSLLHEVQLRRQFPTVVTQFLQLIAHKGIEHVFDHSGPMRPPIPLRLAVRIPGFQGMVARVVGIGIRPEHVVPPQQRRRKEVGPMRRIIALGAGVTLAALVMWRRTVRK